MEVEGGVEVGVEVEGGIKVEAGIEVVGVAIEVVGAEVALGLEVEVGVGVVVSSDIVGIGEGVEVVDALEADVSKFIEIAGSSVSMRSDENAILLLLARIRITLPCCPDSLILSRDLVNDEKECL